MIMEMVKDVRIGNWLNQPIENLFISLDRLNIFLNQFATEICTTIKIRLFLMETSQRLTINWMQIR